MPQRQNPDTFNGRSLNRETAGAVTAPLDYTPIIIVGSFGPFVGLVSSPYTCDPGSQIILAAATSGAACAVTLPPALGDGAIVIVKKMDSNAHNVNISPSGSDQIFDTSGGDSITSQYGTRHYLDVAPGQWIEVSKI